MRTGFASKRAIRPPYVSRETDAWIDKSLSEGASQVNSTLFQSPAKAGATRFLEELYSNRVERLTENHRMVIFDFLKRTEWSLLEFLVDARNQLVSGTARRDPRHLPEFCFSGFGFLAILHWCISQNCESHPPSFADSKYAKSYKKIGKSAFSFLGGSLIEAAVGAVELADIFADIASSALEFSTEERIERAVSKLARSKLPIGTGDAADIRAKLRAGHSVNESELTEALVSEFLRSLELFVGENEDLKILFAFDAIDILETELEFFEAASFVENFETIMKRTHFSENLQQVSGSRNSAELLVSRMENSGWQIVELRPISKAEVRERISLEESRHGADVADKILGADRETDTEPINLLSYADKWGRLEAGVLDEAS